MNFREALRKRLKEASERCPKCDDNPLGTRDLERCICAEIICANDELCASARADLTTLLALVEKAEAALADLLASGLSVPGRNYGKSWSEYQVSDDAITDSKKALIEVRNVLDREEKTDAEN